ncbi:MAG TPA: quinone-interacting membrane-bound oxidoreductase complex subunit QmoC [Anaeromyxobacteraceae bacterium]|nr:quinone-interacting membrane-bound oxidoreductase complex subunit QmoC [Anaeromyxobacteraceae bacterium]
MESAITISPVRAFRAELARRGGSEAARCYQCATCSAVCDLATPQAVFPRRQMLWAQWGLVDRLAADPSIWLCHQCNDCTARCPRDARPGDTMQAIRSLVVEEIGAPRFMARLVGRAAATWPILIGLPVLFWALFVQAVNGFAVARTPLAYGEVVPVWMIYSVFLPAAAFAVLAAAAGARRCWSAWGHGATRNGSLLRGLAAVAADVLWHRRFERCGRARPRRMGHLLLVWGFLGALATTTLLGILMDVFGVKTPLPQLHPVKVLGNLSAVLLAVGVVWLAVNRVADEEAAGRSRAFDWFLLALVVLVVFSGIGAELARALLPVPLALAVYLLHLGTVLSLFLTFPFSKFAHALYRTLAMAHQRLTAERRPS